MGAAINSRVFRVGLLGLLLVAGCFDWQDAGRTVEDASVSETDATLPSAPSAQPDAATGALPPVSAPTPVLPGSPSVPDAAVVAVDPGTELPTCILGVAVLDRCRLR